MTTDVPQVFRFHFFPTAPQMAGYAALIAFAAWGLADKLMHGAPLTGWTLFGAFVVPPNVLLALVGLIVLPQHLFRRRAAVVVDGRFHYYGDFSHIVVSLNKDVQVRLERTGMVVSPPSAVDVVRRGPLQGVRQDAEKLRFSVRWDGIVDAPRLRDMLTWSSRP